VSASITGLPETADPSVLTAAPGTAAGRRRRAGSGKLYAGIGILLFLLLASFVVPALMGSPTEQHLDARLMPPSGSHLFGTDDLGRDIFVRVFAAARTDIALALAGALLPAVIGCVLGLIAGYAGRWVDTVIMRLGDLVQSFPSYVFLLVVAFIVGPGITAFLVAAATISWVNYARLVRSQVLVLRELDYVHAARMSGIGVRRVMGRHVLPNALPQVVVYFAADAVLSLTFLAGLSFLGLGISEPNPEWGLMVRNGTLYLGTAWWLATFPGLMIVLTGGALAFISDALDEKSRT